MRPPSLHQPSPLSDFLALGFDQNPNAQIRLLENLAQLNEQESLALANWIELFPAAASKTTRQQARGARNLPQNLRQAAITLGRTLGTAALSDLARWIAIDHQLYNFSRANTSVTEAMLHGLTTNPATDLDTLEQQIETQIAMLPKETRRRYTLYVEQRFFLRQMIADESNRRRISLAAAECNAHPAKAIYYAERILAHDLFAPLRSRFIESYQLEPLHDLFIQLTLEARQTLARDLDALLASASPRHRMLIIGQESITRWLAAPATY